MPTKFTALLFLSLMLTSCATILNKPTTTVTIHTKAPSKIIFGNDTLETIKYNVRLTAKRSVQPLRIQVATDSIFREMIIESKNSVAFYMNMSNPIIGFPIDWNNQKRYTYPKNVMIGHDGTLKTNMPTKEKGTYNLNFSLPHINSFLLQPDGEGAISNSGFFGIATGVDYHYRDNKFINLTVGAATDLFVPVPAAIDYDGEHETMTSTYLSLTNNHDLDRFSLGYGVSINRNAWALRNETRPIPFGDRQPVIKSNTAIGLSFSSYYRIGKKFHLGITYKPSLISLTAKDATIYEHVISLELLWKIRL